MKSMDWRFFCKAPRCTSGGQRKLDNYDIIGKYFLFTLSHGEWRLCNECVGYETWRKEALTHRSKGSTRPVINNDTLITIDPYIYDDLTVIKDLLALAGVVID